MSLQQHVSRPFALNGQAGGARKTDEAAERVWSLEHPLVISRFAAFVDQRLAAGLGDRPVHRPLRVAAT